MKYRVVKSGLSSLMGMRYQFPAEYTKPLILTSFPGEKHLAALEKVNGDADNLQDAQRFIDFKKSYGSYFVDLDGNRILDMNASSAGVVLGYNN
jgi:4-aminobutyrate aminotransferase-like enzyme